jgi:uncharacterized phage-associated protein
MTVSVYAVADYFIRKVNREAGDDITQFKLQKLLYYAQAWHLAMHDAPLFDNTFEGWVHGPVCPEIYDRFRHLAFSPIPSQDSHINLDMFEQPIQTFLDEVWDIYGQYSATKLEQMTHAEAPWIEARRGLRATDPGHEIINEDTMRSFYRTRIQARRRIREK